MPVVKFKLERLESLIPGVDLGRLEDLLFRLKCEIELDEEGYVHVEVNPDRPDMYSAEGIARAVKGLMGLEKGYRVPPARKSDYIIEASVVQTRPYVTGAVVWDVNVDEDFVEELIQLQEKLHDTIGRGRRRVAIGLHDLDKLAGKHITYKMEDVRDVVFEPLGYGREMTLAEVIESTEHGRKYGKISLSGSMHPVLRAGGRVISVPPVINAEETRVEPGTRSLFIDVTGTDLESVLRTLVILVTSLAERPGASIGLVEVRTPEGPMTTPRLDSGRILVSVKSISSILGISLTPEELAELLARARFNTKMVGSDFLEVEVPPYRFDIMGEADIAEEAAMMIGYEALGPQRPLVPTRGELSRLTRLERTIRSILVGLGYTEALQLTLTSPEAVEALGLGGVAVRVANPVQAEYSVLRPSITVSLLQFLKYNQHREKPVRVFEIGGVVLREGSDIVEEERLGLAIMDDSISYEDIQAPVYALLRLLGIEFTVEPHSVGYLMTGRTARILSSGGEELGWMGEVNPEVLERLGIEYPVALAEVRLPPLVGGEGRFRIRGQPSP